MESNHPPLWWRIGEVAILAVVAIPYGFVLEPYIDDLELLSERIAAMGFGFGLPVLLLAKALMSVSEKLYRRLNA